MHQEYLQKVFYARSGYDAIVKNNEEDSEDFDEDWRKVLVNRYKMVIYPETSLNRHKNVYPKIMSWNL